MLVLFAAFVAAWLLGWMLNVGTSLMHLLLLVAAVISVARLPWRRPG